MAKQTIGMAARFQLYEFVKTVAFVDEEGLCHYKDDHTDKSIAKSFNCSEHTVANIRREVFGRLQKPRSAKLEDRVAYLERELAELKESFRLGELGRSSQRRA